MIGGGNLQNFQKKNYLLDEESDTSEPENNFEISEFNEFSFKKKKNDSKLNLELQKQTTKIDNINITSAFEEDLNQYYSKNQKSEVEKKFMKIQQAHIKKEGQAPTTNKSMKNIFSSVKKIFS